MPASQVATSAAIRPRLPWITRTASAVGPAVVEWIAGYMERIEELPVGSRVAPGEIRAIRLNRRLKNAGSS